MNAEQLEQRIGEVSEGLAPMLANFMDTARLRIASTSVNTYMRDAGVTSPPFPPRRSRSGPLRKLTSRLASSISGARFDGGAQEGIAELNVSREGAEMRMGTRVPYASVHEEGFIGRVNVPAHQRTIVQAFGKPLSKKTTVQVSAHTRFMAIPARPYLSPASEDNEDELQEILSARYQKLVLEVIDGK